MLLLLQVPTITQRHSESFVGQQVDALDVIVVQTKPAERDAPFDAPT